MKKPVRQGRENNEASQRLIKAGLRLFAEKGFGGASTREISDAANVNLSAIRYYFGDKAGLYRAAYTKPLENLPGRANRPIYAEMPFDAALDLFFQDFLAPFKLGRDIGLVMKLRFREMVEPTGAMEREIEAEIKPQHEAMIEILIRRMHLHRSDLDLQRLACAIIGMAVHLFVARDIINAVSPEILNTPDAIDVFAKRLSGYTKAMVNNEMARRGLEAGHETG